MSRSVNKVILIGRLGKDPEVRYTKNATTVANFSIATSDQKKSANGDWEEQTEWHNVVAWKRLAEIAGEYLHKGSHVYIEGKLKTSSWEVDGPTFSEPIKKYKTEIWIENLVMLDSKGNETQDYTKPQGQQQSSPQSQQQEPEPEHTSQYDDSDIPF